jgi:hypothetical protein
MTWLQKRLDELGYTHTDLTDRLAQHDIHRVRGTISGWARGNINVTLLANPDEAQILADVLEWNLPELLIAAGYPIAPDDYAIPQEMLPLLPTMRALNPEERTILVETLLYSSSVVETIQKARHQQVRNGKTDPSTTITG